MQKPNRANHRAARSSPSKSAKETIATANAGTSPLLQGFRQSPECAVPVDRLLENELIQVRLGIASSLFVALRAKHEPTASHCLRVTMGCASWATAVNMDRKHRDNVELAALLHDVGKIAVPDAILRKPSRLDHDERRLMEEHQQIGLDIVAACCESQDLLNVIRYSQAWFDGSREGFEYQGARIPLGARMIAIADAFDSMTTDHVYRGAMSRERAVTELFEFAGRQFDPDLVIQFGELYVEGRIVFDTRAASDWLNDLSVEQSNSRWNRQPLISDKNVDNDRWREFNSSLLENINDGVIFVDTEMRILQWNSGASRLTGLSHESVYQKSWAPELVGMRDLEDRYVRPHDCPVACAMGIGTQSRQRLQIMGRNGDEIMVDIHVIPVVGDGTRTLGATILVRDLSSEATLQERVQNLHARATQDPLTQLSNRAEFDRTHQQFIQTHADQELPYSLIICDIDRFKQINDTYGHQAGDQALTRFATLLKRSCREGDLVARYGGEEFVMVCADCDNAAATARAEEIRHEVARLPIEELGGKYMTVSFGVTELQPGDTPDTMLRRADRALMRAKATGRNRVVQLGAGRENSDPSEKRGWLRGWGRKLSPSKLLSQSLYTKVPVNLAGEKLRGFVADHDAEVLAIDEKTVRLRISAQNSPAQRRSSDRPVPFIIQLEFEECRPGTSGTKACKSRSVGTIVHVEIHPQRNRDRRSSAMDTARLILRSLKSYLMAEEHTFNG